MDIAILQGIQGTFGHPFLDTVFPYLTHLGQAGAIWLLIGFGLIISKKYRFWGFALIGAVAAVGLFNEVILKAIVARPRPFVADPSIQLLISAPTGYSFPSGHAGCAFAAATVIAFMPIGRGWKAGAWVLAVLLAFSRLYLQVHYPTDVLVGSLFGVIYGILAVKIAFLARQRRQQGAKHAAGQGPGA